MTLKTGASPRVGINNSSPTETLDVSGNIKASGTITAGNGLTVNAGGINATSGDITTTGAVKGGSITSTGSITAGNGLTVTSGNLDAKSGDITTTGAVKGGSITSTGSITAGNGLTVTSGNLDAKSGDITTTGAVKGGSITSTGAVSGTTITSSGSITATGEVKGGSITGTTITAGNGSTGGLKIWSSGFSDTTNNSLLAQYAISINQSNDGTIMGHCLPVEQKYAPDNPMAFIIQKYWDGYPNNNRYFSSDQVISLNPFGGRVAINQITASCELDVSGSIIASGTITAGSDYRIKDDITPLNLDEYTVDNLNPVKFKFKESGKENIGLIAHELQQEIPCLVEGEKDGENIQTVNYMGLVGILIKEIQELKRRVSELELLQS